MYEVQLREAEAKLSALVEAAVHGETAVITRNGKPRAVLLGFDEWNRLRHVPSFGSLLLSAPPGRHRPAVTSRSSDTYGHHPCQGARYERVTRSHPLRFRMM